MADMGLQELLLEQGIVDAASLVRAAARADREGRALVQVLVDESLVQEDALAELAANAVGTVVVDVDQGYFDEESVRLVPADAARRHLFIPVAPDPDGESLRVAFADPLDREAVDAVQRLTGLGIQPLVATVSGILTALGRAYGDSRGPVVGGEARHGSMEATLRRSDLPSEATKRVGHLIEATGGEAGTAPLARFDNVATIEQRLEALVLSLIDAGVISRADYMESLRRLLGRK